MSRISRAAELAALYPVPLLPTIATHNAAGLYEPTKRGSTQDGGIDAPIRASDEKSKASGATIR
jgi:hypothetical protein